jgi:hypothetical protein
MTPREALDLESPLNDDTRCAYCRILNGQHGLGNTAFNAEHIIPAVRCAKHGIDLLDCKNLAWACLRCNSRKSNAVNAVDPESGKRVPLFHPRKRRWFGHFRAFADGKIQGVTRIGRGTSLRLQFNFEISVVRHRSRGFDEGWWPGVETTQSDNTGASSRTP